MRKHLFAEELPGVEMKYKDEELFGLFGRVSQAAQNAAIERRRLASPDHYKLYFSLSTASHAVPAANIEAFWDSIDQGVPEGSASFLALYRKATAGSLSEADVLLERLDTKQVSEFPPERSKNLLLVFGTTLDEAYRIRSFDRYWVNSIWDRAERLLPKLLGSLGRKRRRVVENVFGQGAAIAWLTKIFRRETFAHGRYGDQRRPDSEWILTANELERVAAIMINRYRALSFDEVVHSVDPLSLLFAWKQGGDDIGPRRVIEEGSRSDEGFLSALEALQSIGTSSAQGSSHLLKRSEVEDFINYDMARGRAEILAKRKSGTAISERAKQLLQAFEKAESW
jgi:hypothetical protein